MFVTTKHVFLSRQEDACHNKTFVTTKSMLMFVATKYFCCNKHKQTFYLFCHDKHVFVMTKLLSQQKLYLWQLPPMIALRCSAGTNLVPFSLPVVVVVVAFLSRRQRDTQCMYAAVQLTNAFLFVRGLYVWSLIFFILPCYMGIHMPSSDNLSPSLMRGACRG